MSLEIPNLFSLAQCSNPRIPWIAEMENSMQWFIEKVCSSSSTVFSIKIKYSPSSQSNQCLSHVFAGILVVWVQFQSTLKILNGLLKTATICISKTKQKKITGVNFQNIHYTADYKASKSNNEQILTMLHVLLGLQHCGDLCSMPYSSTEKLPNVFLTWNAQCLLQHSWTPTYWLEPDEAPVHIPVLEIFLWNGLKEAVELQFSLPSWEDNSHSCQEMSAW